jgi:hypothetical protein
MSTLPPSTKKARSQRWCGVRKKKDCTGFIHGTESGTSIPVQLGHFAKEVYVLVKKSSKHIAKINVTFFTRCLNCPPTVPQVY